MIFHFFTVVIVEVRIVWLLPSCILMRNVNSQLLELLHDLLDIIAVAAFEVF